MSPWLHVALIVAAAAFFRLWQIDRVPPGLFGDEATDGLDALDVLSGRGAVFFPANYGREGLHMWLVAGMFRLFGVTPLALRLPSAIAGILTVLATYWLGRELVRAEQGERGRAGASHPFTLSPFLWLASWLPFLASLYIATSYWHIHFSRFGIRGVFTPLFGALAFAAFWRAVNQRNSESADWQIGKSANRRSNESALQPVNKSAERQTNKSAHGEGHTPFAVRHSPYAWFALSGLFLGLSLHFYTASRFLPFFLGGFLVLQLLIAAVRGRGDEAILRRCFWGIVLLFVVATLIFAPLAFYFLEHPGSFMQRAGEVAATKTANPLGRMAQAAVANVLQFFVPGAGDVDQFYNLPRRPVFDPVSAILALVGIVALAWRLRQPTALFVLMWFVALLVPSFLATDRWPTLPRVLGTIPAVYFFPAIGLLVLLRLADSWWRRPGAEAQMRRGAGERWVMAEWAHALVPALVCAGALLIHAGFTYRDYFRAWGSAQATFDAFEGDMVAASKWLRSNRSAGHVYLSSDLYRHPTFMLLGERATVQTFFSHQNPDLSWFDGRAALPLPPEGQAATYVVGSSGALAERAIAILGPGARERDRIAAPDGSAALRVIELPAGGRPGLPNTSSSPIVFSDQLALLGAQLDRSQARALWLVLTWQTGERVEAGQEVYRLEVYGARPNGDPWQDDLPFEAFRPPEWVAGGRLVTWHKLNVPDAQPLAALRLRLLHEDGSPLSRPGAPDGWHTIPD